ncbi:carboxypeptidase-like regulatory domain-containing protein [Polaribacter sargassicola]|uniref:carboxypeptidase-like regulatory domain-containing protein n=1 Tax=Polaribacter sargassicola TaxID=2836891 RepID=UPI001F3944FF|nr:carboxypeptidase-like regulatory domain-containing protein [Polaribacter sp. DS7-9]MCG1036694.1 carboxypeptidase-like regulatory domain-containing protein [Polaribacter sp. DS7-9]
MRYKVQIPKPCNQNWNKMTPTERGAFCSICQKEVLDFTKKSNFYLAKILDNNQEICGKFKAEQLNTEISSIENNKYSNFKFLLGISTFLSLTNPLFSQKKIVKINKVAQFNQSQEKDIFIEKVSDSIQIKGFISDDNFGLPGVNVYLKKQFYGVQTDFDGKFSINIDSKEIEKNVILVISYLGFKSQEVKISNKTKFLNIVMEEDDVILGEVVIVKKQNIFRKIGRLFKKNN